VPSREKAERHHRAMGFESVQKNLTEAKEKV